MSETTTKVLWFIFGAACGSIASWFVFKKRYEKEDDFELTPDMFGRDEDGDSHTVYTFTTVPKEVLSVPANKIDGVEATSGYFDPKPVDDNVVISSDEYITDYTTLSGFKNEEAEDPYKEALNFFKNKEVEEEYERVEKPYVISPDEFGELYDYSKVSLFYWADGVLTDDDYYRIDDEFDLKSLGVLEMFESGDVDAVYIRNDRKQQDIEVLYELRTYVELLEEKPYLKE